jgi:hypothetical protein
VAIERTAPTDDLRGCCETADVVLLLGDWEATVAGMPAICCARTTLQAPPPTGEFVVQTRRTYASKARQYLAWLAAADLDGDPLESPDGRDSAVRDYRTHLQAVLKRKPATVNNALSAVDDLYIRRGFGPASAARVEIPARRPTGSRQARSDPLPASGSGVFIAAR